MNESPEQSLYDLLQREGIQLVQQPQKLLELLRISFNDYKREFYILKSCLEEGIVKDLIESSQYIPVEILFPRMAEKLQISRAMDAEAAKWGIEVWARALALMPKTNTRDYELKFSEELGLDLDNPFLTHPDASPEEKLKKALELAIADGVLTTNEKQVLQDLCQLLNIPMDKVQVILEEVKKDTSVQ